jgi:hypothetical protein
MQAWVEKELRTSDLGDERLNKRFATILDELSQKPSVGISTACEDWANTLGCYRFFDNDRVDSDDVLAPHYDATLDRIAEHKVVLLAQDTTEIDITRPEEKMDGAGPLNDESRIGFFNHAMLAITPENIPLGVVDANIWARDLATFRSNKRKTANEKRLALRHQPIEEKESIRWLQSHWRGCEIAEQAPETTVVVISDSEGDIFEYFEDAQQNSEKHRAQWIIRACQDRNVLSGGDRACHEKLWTEVGSADVVGTMEVEVSRNKPKAKSTRKRQQPRSARTAKLTIHATKVTLRAPSRVGTKLADVQVNVVLVREKDPPAGEEPVEWLLLTSLPITSFKKICLVIEYYCCRWTIEIYFRVLKSGCGVEKLQLETASRFLPCLATYMIIAWRVMYVMMLGRECPEMSCADIFSDDEWKSVYTVVQKKPAPKKPPTLEEIVWMIGQLGGHLGRTHDGPPGPKAMWVGMQRMTDLALAWRTFGPGIET